MTQTVFLTSEGIARLKGELVDLKEKREQIVTRIEDVGQPGEFGEDVLVSQLKQELEITDAKINEINEALKTAKPMSGNNSGEVSVGHKITIRSSEHTRELHLVCELEADPLNGKVSDRSPLGQALLGRKIGDEISVEAPVGVLKYKIVSIA